jgi:hypothetical protein
MASGERGKKRGARCVPANDQTEPCHLGQKIVAIEQAFALFGATLAEREESREPAPGGAVLRIGEDVGRTIGKDEPGAGGEFQACFLCGLMGTYDARDRIAVGNADPSQPKGLGAIHQLFRMGGTAEEREIGGDGELGIGGHTRYFQTQPNTPCRNQRGAAVSRP